LCKDGYLYGMFSFKKYGVGPLKCVELATGKVVWEQPGFGAGNVILVGDKLVALADNGTLVVAEATPAAYKEVSRTKAVAGKCWSTPALSDGRIYVRSTKEGACLDVAGQ
jgi:outer membrane protein assembly factor BamB